MPKIRPSILQPEPSTRPRCGFGICLLLAQISCWGMTTEAMSQQGIAPIYWQQPVLFIPYQINPQATGAGDVSQVQLLLSRTGTSDWSVLQAAKPNVQGFSYHAPEDGTYWFALRHLDSQGRPLGPAVPNAQLQLVIDTQQPQLQLSASLTPGGEVVVQYEASDAHLQSDSLVLEVRPRDGLWTNLSLASSAPSQLGMLAGRTSWVPNTSVGEIRFRGSIADRAGHRGQSETSLVLTGPALTMPDRTPDSRDSNLPPNLTSTSGSNNADSRDPFQFPEQPAAQDWPASNEQPSSRAANHSAGRGDPGTSHIVNPFVNQSEGHIARRTPAHFAVDGAEGPKNSDSTSFERPRSPNLLHSQPNSENTPNANPSTVSDWNSTGEGENLVVNSRTFDVEYDIQSVSSFGVARVELWGTEDGGNTWQSFGVDPDNRSPIRATVGGAGIYGFRILVDGANGIAAVPPQAGEEPELVVAVDLQPPLAKLLAVEPGQNNQIDHLTIRWSADDDNLDTRPISLFYGSSLSGPWSTIAAGLENSGSYSWRIERHVPERFYVRLEARDTAGNVTSSDSPQPVTLNRPQPTGRLRTIRPVTGVPTVRVQ